MEALDKQDVVAIRVGDGQQAFLVARYPDRGKRYSMKGIDGKVSTQAWNERYHRKPMPFSRIVDEILDEGTKGSRK